jgi:hypothetical protein
MHINDMQVAQTVGWSLADVVARLSQHLHVEGIMQIGSLTTTTRFNPASDYDLVIVLADAPQTWYVGVTSIDSRFTDLIFVAQSALTSIAALVKPLATDDALTPLVRWLQHGQILFDRSQQLAHAQQHVTTGDWIEGLSDAAVFGAWFALNYNLAQARRLLLSNDPLYQATADIRMALYGHMDVWWSYFTIRKLPEAGEKTAIRYLQEHDPAFLTLYQHFIAETNRARKLELYEQAAAHVVAPVGGLWPPNTTAMNIPDTLTLWNELLGTEGGSMTEHDPTV